MTCSMLDCDCDFRNQRAALSGAFHKQVRADLEAHAPRALAVARPLRVVITNLPADHVESVQAKV